MSKTATVLLSTDNKSATVIAVNGARVTVVAQTTLSFWARKDGGVTLRADAEHKSQTVRVDAFGRLTTSKPKSGGKGKARRLRSVA